MGNKHSQPHVALFTASGQFPHHTARRGDPERASDPQCGAQRADVKRAKEGRAGLCPDTPSSAEGCPRGFDWSPACAYGRERQQKIGEKYWNTVGRAPPTVHTCGEIVSVPTGQSDFLLHGIKPLLYRYLGLLGGLSGKDPAGLILGSGRFLEGENDNSPQYSCLENSMDREAWQAPVQGIAESQTSLSNWAYTHTTYRYFTYSRIQRKNDHYGGVNYKKIKNPKEIHRDF